MDLLEKALAKQKEQESKKVMQRPIIASEPVIEEIKIKQTTGKIDDKINSIINERLLKLVKIGLKHELTIENIKEYFREVGKSKLYELRRYFSDSNLNNIKEMLDFLHKNKILIRDQNGWYYLKT